MKVFIMVLYSNNAYQIYIKIHSWLYSSIKSYAHIVMFGAINYKRFLVQTDTINM